MFDTHSHSDIHDSCYQSLAMLSDLFFFECALFFVLLCGEVTEVTTVTDCFLYSEYGIFYNGTTSVTESGIPCKRWDEVEYVYYDGINSEDENYCRSPSGLNRPWCHTNDPIIMWEDCAVPNCDDITTISLTTTTPNVSNTEESMSDIPNGYICTGSSMCFSIGSIAGMCIGCLVVLVILGVIVMIFCKSKKGTVTPDVVKHSCGIGETGIIPMQPEQQYSKYNYKQQSEITQPSQKNPAHPPLSTTYVR